MREPESFKTKLAEITERADELRAENFPITLSMLWADVLPDFQSLIYGELHGVLTPRLEASMPSPRGREFRNRRL